MSHHQDSEDTDWPLRSLDSAIRMPRSIVGKIRTPSWFLDPIQQHDIQMINHLEQLLMIV